MNRGDFGAVYLPRRLNLAGTGCYTIGNKAGFPLGLVAAGSNSTLKFALPKTVLDQLTADGLVTATTIDLYDDARAPTTSAANLERYLDLLASLIPLQVSDP